MAKKKNPDKWQWSDAKKILKKALAKGEDERGNKVLLDGRLRGQRASQIFPFFKDLPEFQRSDFSSKDLFTRRLYDLREAVIKGKQEATRCRLTLENSLEINPIPDKRLFVDVALPSLRIDMDAGKHLLMTPKELHKTRPEYLEFALEKFRKHIHQETYTRKACIQYKWKGSANVGEPREEEIFKVDSLEEDPEGPTAD